MQQSTVYGFGGRSKSHLIDLLLHVHIHILADRYARLRALSFATFIGVRDAHIAVSPLYAM